MWWLFVILSRVQQPNEHSPCLHPFPKSPTLCHRRRTPVPRHPRLLPMAPLALRVPSPPPPYPPANSYPLPPALRLLMLRRRGLIPRLRPGPPLSGTASPSPPSSRGRAHRARCALLRPLRRILSPRCVLTIGRLSSTGNSYPAPPLARCPRKTRQLGRAWRRQPGWARYGASPRLSSTYLFTAAAKPRARLQGGVRVLLKEGSWWIDYLVVRGGLLSPFGTLSWRFLSPLGIGSSGEEVSHQVLALKL